MADTPTAIARPEAGDRNPDSLLHPRVYVCLLNWNGWADTITCLESLLRGDYPNFQVVVCDNASADGSPERIAGWADGDQVAHVPQAPALAACTDPPVAKPLDYRRMSRDEAEAGYHAGEDVPLVLIQTGANLGYAGGNNVALRYVLAQGDADYVWILNNDTVVRPDALSELVKYGEQHGDVGLCGSVLLDYEQPERVQALGGARFNGWLATHRALGAGRSAAEVPEPGAVERQMSYVIGAAMFASRQWLEETGLLCEDYFLYFEEIDWAVRGADRLRLGFAARSVVYHKNGASTGRPSDSPRADLLALRNRLLFTRKRMPWALPTVWLGLLAALVNRLRRGQADRVGPLLAVMFGRTRSARRTRRQSQTRPV